MELYTAFYQTLYREEALWQAKTKLNKLLYLTVTTLFRLNVDQVPLPFDTARDVTYEEKGVKRVRNTGTGGGDTERKRMATLQICIRAVPENQFHLQPKIALIFRGTGRVMKQEQEHYHPDCDVYFQKNAWVDTATASKWAAKTLAHSTQKALNTLPAGVQRAVSRHLLFMDNLTSQRSAEFLAVLKGINVIPWWLPPNTTDDGQPVDAGVGANMKHHIGNELNKWLLSDEAPAPGTKLALRDKRIRMTHWAAEAFKRCNESFHGFERLFCNLGLSEGDHTESAPDMLGGGIRLQFFKDLKNPDGSPFVFQVAKLDPIEIDEDGEVIVGPGDDNDDAPPDQVGLKHGSSDGAEDDDILALFDDFENEALEEEVASSDEEEEPEDKLTVDDLMDGFEDEIGEYDLDFPIVPDYEQPQKGDHVAIWYPDGGWYACIIRGFYPNRKDNKYWVYSSDNVDQYANLRRELHPNMWVKILGCDLTPPTKSRRRR